LKDHEQTVAEVHRSLPVGALYEHAIRFEKDASIADNGALLASSGAKTGRHCEFERENRPESYQNNISMNAINRLQ
jgi:phosphoenolpyruvate carboxykinase (ATP)